MTTHRKLLSGAGRRRGPVRKKPAPLALEARLMFDGAALTTVTAVIPDAGPEAAPVEPRPVLAAVPTTYTATSERERLDTPESAPAPAREIAFVDTSVADWQTLVQDVRPGVEVILLDPARDGLAQIAEVLQGQTDLDAVHIVSHGAEGALILGGQSYSADTLSQYQTELTTIAQSLSTEGDLLLYGCDIAQGSAGAHFIAAVADATQADVAASINTTGGVNSGGDWRLEAATGAIGAASFADLLLLDNYDARLTTINLSGNTGWVPVMIGTNFDPQGDSQAGAADTDLVGDATHAAMYVAFDDGGTAGSGDESMLFRIRVDNPTSSTNFGGVAIIGIDANLDGRIDLFFAVDGRNNSQSVRMFDPGTGLNNSPSNTTTSPLPTGWLPNNGIYPFSALNYAVTAVSSSTDPNWNGDNDLGNDGKTDVLVTFKIPLADIATVLAKPSAVDRNGVVGPRGPNGISGFNENTQVRYVLMSQTQPGPINGDLGGVGANYDRDATFEQLGSFTAAMSPADPVPAGSSLSVIEPVGDGNLSATEDTSVTLSGTSANLANGTGLTITISDGSTSVTTSATVNSNAWSVSGVDLSSLADGTLTVTVETTSGTTVIDSATVLHDRTPPTIAITGGTAYNDTTPTITGTSNLPAGSVITITIDPDNDSATGNSLIYTTTVLIGGGFALDTGVVAPVSGTFPATGLPAYSKITVSGVDAAGNSTTTTALNKPTVNSFTTNDTTPTLSGTWTNIPGDTLTVTVNGTTYTTGTGLSVSGNSWSLTTGALPVGTYDVSATVTRAATSTSDATTGELVVVSGPAISITGGASTTTNNTAPMISGTSTVLNDFITVRIDPGNDGVLTDAVTYSVTTDGSGNWSLDTATATPIAGFFPAAGLSATAGILATATDGTGAATYSQALTVTTPVVSINTPISGGYFNDAEDNSVSISGTTVNVSDGQQVTVQVSDGDNTVSGTATVNSGAWTVTGLNLSTLKEGTLTITATRGSATDSETVVHDTMVQMAVISQFVSSPRPVISGRADTGTVNVSIDVYKKSGASIVYDTTVTFNNVSVSGGTWSIDTGTATPTSGTVPSNALNNADEYYAITVTGTDTAGNTVSATGKVMRSSTTGTLSIGTIAGDNSISESEDNSVTISGTTSQTAGLVKVTVTDGTNTSTQTVTAVLGNWSTTGLNLDSFKDGTLTVKAELLVSVVDSNVIATAIASPTHANSSTAAPTVTITDNVPGLASGNVTYTFQFSQDVTGFDASDITVTGGTKGSFTAVSGSQYTLVVTPTADTNSGTITVDVGANAAQNGAGTGNTAATQATQAYDTLAPTLAVTSGASATDTTPIITGTSNLPAGSTITVTIDPNNDGVLTDQVVYTATVQSGGAWSVNTETATPTSGTLGTSGLTSYAKITASGSDAAGNTTTATALNRPTVNSLFTNDTTPTLTGTWTNLGSDTLSVTVDGTTYTTSSGVSISGNTWSLTTNSLSGGTYSVTATATRGGSSVTDATASELVIDTTAPAVAITSSALTADTAPVISGTTDLPDGIVLTITVDPDNDNGTNNSISYTAVVSGGTWSVNTETALPTSGSFPASGLIGTIGVSVSGTDAAGNTTTATQTLTVDNVPPVIAITTNAKTPDSSPVITGTTDLAAGATITLEIDPNNDGNYADAYTYTLTVQAGGTWSVDTGTVAPDGGGATITLAGTVGLRVTGVDSLGNSASATKSLLIDTSAPAVAINEPVGDGDISGAEDDTVVIQGTTTDIPDGSTLAISITDGTRTIVDTVTVTGNAWSMSAIDLSSLSDGPIAITATYTDDDGNAFTDTAAFTHDATLPNVNLTAAGTNITGPVTVTATFNEAVTGLTAGDFATSNGAAVSNLVQVNATTWTFTLTPAVDGAASVWLPASRVQDAAGNDNAISSALNFTATLGVPDTVAPTITSIVRQSPAGGLTNADSLTFRASFSEDMLNVDSGDFALSGAGAAGASIQSVSAVLGQPGVYDVVVTGISNANGAVNLALVASPTLTDAASNALTDTTVSLSQGYTLDNVAPVLASSNGAVINASSLVLSYNEALAATTPASGDFSVVINGATPVTVTGVSVNTVANTVTLTLSTAVTSTDSVTVTYTPGGNKTQDLAGNAAAALTTQTVTNNTPDTALPTLTSIDDGDADNSVTAGDVLTYTVTFNEDIDSSTVSAADFSNAGTAGITVGTITETSPGVFSVQVTTTSAGSLQLRVNAGAVIEDAAGNDLNTGSAIADDTTVTVVSADATAPAAPTLSLLASSDSGESNSDRITSDDTPIVRATLNGSGASAPVAGDVVKIYLGVTEVGTATLSASDISAGYVDITTSTLGADGAKSLTATITDAANNVSGASSALSVTLNTSAPTVTIDDGDGDDTVASGAVLTYTISFSEDIDSSTVTAADFSNAGTAGITIGTITETSPGVFSVQVTVTSAGSLQLQVNAGAVIKDVAGNNLDTGSAVADDTTVTVDATAPAAPTLSLLASSDSGESNSDRITNDATPTVRVTLNGSGASAPVAGDVVDIYLGASLVGTATLGAADITAGYIDITTSSLGSDGAKSLTATITDGVSNVSSASTALSVTLNTSAPTVSIDDGDADDTVTVGDTLTYTLTFSDDVDSSTVSAADFSNTGTAGITIGTITETSPGVFTVDVTVTSAGSLALQVNAGAVIQDVAGNNLNTTSAIVDATSVTVDAALAAPTINAMMTVNTTPTLSGTWGGVNGGSDTLSVTVDGVSYTTANGLVIVGNTWTLAIPSSNALSAGRHDVVATVARAGGGSVSDASSGEVMIVAAPVATPRPETPTPAPALLDNVIPFVGTIPSSGGSHFDSQLGLSAAVDPLRPVSTTLARLSDHFGRAATTDPLFEQMLTSRGDNAFRIVVAKADEPSLLVFRGIPDQGINAGALVNYRIPVDAFVHTDPKAVVTLRASLTDGRPLPKWLSFDPATGKFAGKPPRGTGETLSVLVLARDGEGREAATIFRIQLDKDKIVKDKNIRRDSGRASLSEQIQAAAQRGDQRAHYASLYAGRYSK